MSGVIEISFFLEGRLFVIERFEDETDPYFAERSSFILWFRNDPQKLEVAKLISFHHANMIFHGNGYSKQIEDLVAQYRNDIKKMKKSKKSFTDQDLNRIRASNQLVRQTITPQQVQEKEEEPMQTEEKNDILCTTTVVEKDETPLTQCVKVAELRKAYQGVPDINLEWWMNQPNNLYVGRPGRVFITEADGNKRVFSYPGSKWANPYKVGSEQEGKYSLDRSLELYREYVLNSELKNQLDELEGMTLGCFCIQDKKEKGKCGCHAQVLAELYKIRDTL